MGLMGQSSGSAAPATSGGSASSKKAEAAARFKERKAAKQKAAHENALKLRDELTKQGLLDKLTPAVKEFVINMCLDPAEKRAVSGGASGSSTFNTLFGGSPKVGDKITLEDAFKKTFKGKAALDAWIKRWAEKGIIVKFVVHPTQMLQSTYEITGLPA